MPKGWKGSVIDYCACCGNNLTGRTGKSNLPLWCEDCVDHLDGRDPAWQESWYRLHDEECPNAEVTAP